MVEGKHKNPGMASVGWMLDNRDLEGSDCSMIENLLSRHMPRETEKYHEIP
jgi:hypothetical protein